MSVVAKKVLAVLLLLGTSEVSHADALQLGRERGAEPP
jgi:hypothetical protein